MDSSNPAPEAQRSARRGLVRGVFAAPAVLALYSGSAAAMASNLRCVNNQVGAGQKIFPAPVGAEDRFVRVRLWSLRNGTSEPRWFLRGNDFLPLTLGSSSVTNTFLGPGQWWEFNPTAQLLVGDRLPSKPEPGTLAHDGAWVAVRIAADSKGAGIVGVVVSDDLTGSAVSGLCWASFVTAAR